MRANGTHRVRKQPGRLLPSGGRRINFYTKPHEYGGTDQLIDIPVEDIDKLLAEYDRPDLLQFGSDEMVALCETLYAGVGSPAVSALVGWPVFTQMIQYLLK